jgi:hypothetical protein
MLQIRQLILETEIKAQQHQLEHELISELESGKNITGNKPSPFFSPT